MNNFSSLIEVLIAFNVAFIIGNNFAEKVCNNFYFNKNLINLELETLKTEIEALIKVYRDDLVEQISSQIIDIKEQYYTSKHTQFLSQLENVNQLTITDINVYSFINMIYSIFLLIIFPLENQYPFKVLFFTLGLAFILFIWEFIVFIVHINFSSEDLNRIFKNPILSLYIILPTMLIIVLVIFVYPSFVDYIYQLLLPYKGVLYTFILSLPALHFVPFLLKIWFRINNNEKALIKNIDTLKNEIESDTKQVTNISLQRASIIIV
jgi:hypothetical protein